MSVCVLCAAELGGDANLCGHHHSFPVSDWAAENRIMCDFIHRGIVPPRLAEAQRADDLVTAREAA
jgi:hypothetical protein